MRILQTPLESITRLAYRPDGQHLAALGPWGHEVRGYVVSMKTGRARPMAELSCLARGRYALSPDASRVVAVWTEREGDFSSLRFFRDCFAGCRNRLSQTNLGAVMGYAFSPDSRTLALATNFSRYPGGRDPDRYGVTLWDASGRRERRCIETESPAVLLALTNEGRFAYLDGAGTLHWWEPELEVDTICPSSGHVRGLCFSSDGRRLVSWGAAGIVVRDVITLEKPAHLPTDDFTATVTLSPDGRWLVTSDAASFRRVRDYAWPIEKLGAVAFAHDGLTCAVGGADGRIVVWDVDE
jgi:WD40 repeat protein